MSVTVAVDDPAVNARCTVLVANGRHNAFPTICRWQGAYWIAYREGVAHAAGPAQIVVLRSPDALSWSEAFRIDHLFDNRDPHLIEFDGALWLYFVARDSEGVLHPLATRLIENGPEAVVQVYRDGYVFWRPAIHNGRIYAAAYALRRERKLELVASQNGFDWDRVSSMSDGRPGQWSETALHIDNAGTMTAYLRLKWNVARNDAALAQVWRAEPPYDGWENLSTLPFRIEGPTVVEVSGVRYLITRAFNREGSCASLDIHIMENDVPRLHCSIPCMRDAAYGHAVEHAGELLIAFYCTVPDGVNLYLAHVPLA